MKFASWVGFDLDATLAEYHAWPSDGSIGSPIPVMVDRVRSLIATGREVRIFTSRVWPLGTLAELSDKPDDKIRVEQAKFQLKQIQDWCVAHVGLELPVTCVKDFAMVEFWDDRAVQVVPNTGRRVDGKE